MQVQFESRIDSIEAGLPAREQLLFTLLTQSDLGHYFPEYLATGELSYWRAAYFMVSKHAQDTTRASNFSTAFEQLLELPMAASSRGFILYLASKLEYERGRTNFADRYMERLEEETPLMHKHLMQSDDNFDIYSLSGWNNQTR